MAETVQRDFLFPNLGFDDLLSLSVVLQKEMQNPAKYRVEAPPSALAADESQIKVPALAFYANDITRVPASFLKVVPICWRFAGRTGLTAAVGVCRRVGLDWVVSAATRAAQRAKTNPAN